VRPHPSRVAEWQGVDLVGLNAVLWGGNPVDAQSRADYFDSLYYSAAVAGINTSAFIEAGIVGRPVHTIIVPEMASNQTGTVHFNYLLNAGGGLLEVARSFEEHAAQLDASLASPAHDVKPFVREFVRPNGLGVPATPVFIDFVESMAALEPAAPRPPRLQGLWLSLAARAARTRDDERYERWTLSERELASLQKLRGARQVKAQDRKNARDAMLQEREERRAAEERRRADKAAAKAQQLAEKRARADAERAARQRVG